LSKNYLILVLATWILKNGEKMNEIVERLLRKNKLYQIVDKFFNNRAFDGWKHQMIDE
jgi:hypothetical protein